MLKKTMLESFWIIMTKDFQK